MATPVWQFFLANSSDMSLIGDLTHEARGKSLQLALNRPGSFNFNLPLSSEFAPYLDPVKYCIIAMKNKNIVWSGPLWTKQETLHDSKISLSAVGWFQLLTKRVTLVRLSYTAQRRGAIAMDLLARANSTQNTYVGTGSNTDVSTPLSIKIYEKYANIGAEIQSLSATEAGFDFKVDPINRQLNIKNYTEYTNQTDVVFGFNWGPHNVGQVTRTTDADEMANQIIAIYSNRADAASDATAQSNYRLFQKVLNISENVDPTLGAAIANAEVAINKNPRSLITFTPRLYGTPNVPSILEDYDIGDKVYLTAKRDSVDISNQAVRVFSANIEIDSNGNEATTGISTTAQASN